MRPGPRRPGQRQGYDDAQTCLVRLHGAFPVWVRGLGRRTGTNPGLAGEPGADARDGALRDGRLPAPAGPRAHRAPARQLARARGDDLLGLVHGPGGRRAGDAGPLQLNARHGKPPAPHHHAPHPRPTGARRATAPPRQTRRLARRPPPPAGAGRALGPPRPLLPAPHGGGKPGLPPLHGLPQRQAHRAPAEQHPAKRPGLRGHRRGRQRAHQPRGPLRPPPGRHLHGAGRGSRHPAPHPAPLAPPRPPPSIGHTA